MVQQDAQRLAGAIEMEVGEGRTNIPVGTMMSMIEQQTQVMAAVHKRLHTSQAQELLMLRDEFAEDQENLRWLNRDPNTHPWEQAQEFMDLNLVPASDPNIPAQTHRVMQATALVTLASSNPDIYDRVQVHQHALRTIGIINSTPFLHEPTPTPPDPSQQGGKAPDPLGPQKLALQQEEQQRKAAQDVVDSQRRSQEAQMRSQTDAAELASRERIAQLQEQTQRIRLQVEQQRSTTEQSRANAQAKHSMGLAERAHVRDDITAAHKIQMDRHKASTEGLAARHETQLGQIEQHRENRLAQHQMTKDRHDQVLDTTRQGLDFAKAHHEMSLGRRESEREDRLAHHEITQPPPAPTTPGKRKPRGKSPGAKK
jgi:hypothetical protein